ncbi:MAG: DNA internalization-related competence protein ComEC/Rec2, partial [Gemmatimonadota bacterium]
VGTLDAGRWLADGLATSVAATVATAPFVAWHFGRIAPVGIAANLVAIPLLSLAVPALALALVAGAVWLPAGRFLADAGTLLLDGLDATARIAAGAPGAAVALPASTAVVATAAAGLAWMVTRRLGRVRGGVRAAAWGAVSMAVLLVAPVRPVVDRVEVHVIDVGQGDAVAIRSPAGRWLLTDAGIATDGYDAGARIVVPYLGHRGVRRLEGLVVTHPDADHMGGAAAVLEAFRPRWVAGPAVRAPKSAYLALLRTAAGHGIPWIAARRGMTFELDGMTVEVLHPPDSVVWDDANDASVVTRVVYGEFEALLTGDAPAEVERVLVRRYGRRLDADILKVGHHGSITSTTPELLAAADVDVALISAGRGNRYGHPHRAVIDRLTAADITVARTDRHGSIVVRGNRAGRFTVHTDRGELALPPGTPIPAARGGVAGSTRLPR